MSIASLSLVALAALIHASWNLLAKRAADVGPAFVFAYNLVACVAYAPWAIWLLASGKLVVSGTIWLWVLASALVHLVYSLCLQRGYQVADLSVVYPVARGTGPMLSSIAAFILLGERASAEGVCGLATVLAGIGCIATDGRLQAFRSAEALRGVRWGIGTGALIATYTIVDAYAVKALAVPPVILEWFSNAVRFFLLLPVALRTPGGLRARMRGHWLEAISVGLLAPLGYILVLAALQQGAPVSLVAPAREMSMMIGALMGMVLLSERVSRWRLSGCALIMLGVVLIAQ